MIKVSYEEYINDYNRTYKTQAFYNLSEFVDWFFGKCKGKYNKDISVPDPDSDIWRDGPSCMEVRAMWTEGRTYWIHMIQRDGGIIYTDGIMTNHQTHWNDETKELCRQMRKRRDKPMFNFI